MAAVAIVAAETDNHPVVLAVRWLDTGGDGDVVAMVTWLSTDCRSVDLDARRSTAARNCG